MRWKHATSLLILTKWNWIKTERSMSWWKLATKSWWAVVWSPITALTKTYALSLSDCWFLIKENSWDTGGIVWGDVGWFSGLNLCYKSLREKSYKSVQISQIFLLQLIFDGFVKIWRISVRRTFYKCYESLREKSYKSVQIIQIFFMTTCIC